MQRWGWRRKQKSARGKGGTAGDARCTHGGPGRAPDGTGWREALAACRGWPKSLLTAHKFTDEGMGWGGVGWKPRGTAGLLRGTAGWLTSSWPRTCKQTGEGGLQSASSTIHKLKQVRSRDGVRALPRALPLPSPSAVRAAAVHNAGGSAADRRQHCTQQPSQAASALTWHRSGAGTSSAAARA